MRPLWCKLQEQKICAGRKSNITSLENEVLMVLIYYRCYISYLQLGIYFNLDESNVCRHFQKIEPLLAQVLTIKKDRTLSATDLDRVIIDATEIPIQRPKNKKAQKTTYSGKKKRHTLKFEIFTTLNGKILSVSKCFGGKTHDFSIRKSSEHVPKHVEALVDSGYQGIAKLHANSTVPYKRPKGGTLTDEQKTHNRILASRRITVEHVFACLKKFKILGSVYRNFRRKLHMRFNIISGIYNLKFS